MEPPSQAIWQAHLDEQVAAHITATAVTDVFYVARRHAGRDRAWHAIHVCLDQLYVIAVGAAELQAAAMSGSHDFEDSLPIACAAAARLDAIVTRDPGGFVGSRIVAVEPSEFVNRLAGGS